MLEPSTNSLPKCDLCKSAAAVLFVVKFQGDTVNILYRCDAHKPDPARSKAVTYPIQPDETTDGLLRLKRAAIRAYFERH